LIKEARSAENDLIDFLHCVPASDIEDLGTLRRSKLSALLEAQGLETWDAVDEQVRQEFPRSSNVCRILHYESNRGLEGWTTILDGFDEAIEQRQFWDLERGSGETDAIPDPERRARLAAWRWAMISLTRPIDTLLVTVRNVQSEPSR